MKKGPGFPPNKILTFCSVDIGLTKWDQLQEQLTLCWTVNIWNLEKQLWNNQTRTNKGTTQKSTIESTIYLQHSGQRVWG